jgi:hypothetical protein
VFGWFFVFEVKKCYNISMETNNTALKLKNNFKENKPAWIVGGVVVLAIIAAIIFSVNKKDAEKAISPEDGCQAGFAYNTVTGEKCPEETASAMPEGCENGNKFSTKSGVPCVQGEKKTDATPAAGTSPSKTLSLAEALKFYAGNVFKVSGECAVTPAKQTVSKGTRIMVHNDSTKTHTVLVGSQSLSILPYHYRTVLLDTTGAVSLKCDSKQAATVTVQ